jgi:hypothetical protein
MGGSAGFAKRLARCAAGGYCRASNAQCGRSSGVERNLAKVEVEGSNPFARSTFLDLYNPLI